MFRLIVFVLVMGLCGEGGGGLQLPALAATWRAALPMLSRAAFKRRAIASSGVVEGGVGFVEVITSRRRSVLLRRQASIISSRGVAPCWWGGQLGGGGGVVFVTGGGVG